MKVQFVSPIFYLHGAVPCCVADCCRDSFYEMVVLRGISCGTNCVVFLYVCSISPCQFVVTTRRYTFLPVMKAVNAVVLTNLVPPTVDPAHVMRSTKWYPFLNMCFQCCLCFVFF